MYNSRNHLPKFFSGIIIVLLIMGLVSPATGYFSNLKETHEQTNDFTIMSDDEWTITNTKYVNVSRSVDSNITIRNDGKLIINDATLTLLIDEYHPWEIKVREGGELILNNGTITTKPRENLLRPFIKTNISAHGGSRILMQDGSEFRFPGWVYIRDSTFTMKDSTFDKLPDEEIPYDEDLMIDDNNDCPRFAAEKGSHVLIEDSQILNYYRHSNLNNIEMEWRTQITTLNEDDGQYYELNPTDTLNINQWYLHEPALPIGDYRYVNPYNRISSLYIEIRYDTEDNYSADSNLEYNVDGTWKNALDVSYTDAEIEDYSDIWEIKLNSFEKTNENFINNLQVRLQNSDVDQENRNISIDKINLVSNYNNDINIWNSDISIINSQIDVDFEPADTDPREGYEGDTNDETWMEDSNLEHCAIRMVNSSLKAYGIYPTGTWGPDGDPVIVADSQSKNNTWIYRWVTVTPRDSSGTPLSGANVTATLDDDYKEVSQQLYNNVVEANNPKNNPEAWDYMNRTGQGYYDSSTDRYVTGNKGQATMFLTSDRINHPDDWPNSKKVGDYTINASHPDLQETGRDISLEAFPNLNQSATFEELEIIFDGEIPHPDFDITNDDLKIKVNDNDVNYVTTDTELTLELNVTNSGTLNATNVNVTFFMERVGNVLDYTELAELNMSENKFASVKWTPTTAGDYNIVAMVDPNDDILELNETNNLAVNGITIGEKPELLCFDVAVDPGNTVTDGEDVYIAAGVSNIGGTDADNVNVSFYYDETNFIGSKYIDIAGNGTSLVTSEIKWDYPGVGEYVITVMVDTENTVEEGDETNNEYSENLTVLSKPDLVPVNFQVSPTGVYDGNQVTLRTQIENIGETTSSSIGVTFYVDKDTTSEEVIYSTIVSGLNGGELSNPIEITWNAEMIGSENLSEDRTLTVVVNDPKTVQNEGVTGNNREDSTITIMKPADLSIANSDISFSTDLSQKGTEMDISAIVKNEGGANAVTNVTFYDGEPSDSNIIDTVEVSVNMQSEETVTVQWTPETRGNHEIYVIAHYQNYELVKDNNEAMAIKPIFSENYANDLIVDNDNTPVEISGTYGRNGFVVVRENGELRITGTNTRTTFEMIMDRDHKYSIMVRDQGSLLLDYSLLYSDYDFTIYLEDTADLQVIHNSQMPSNIDLVAIDNSNVQIDETTFEGDMDIRCDTFTAEESDFTSQDIFFQPSNVDCVNCTFEDNLVDFYDTTGSLTAVETGSIEAAGDSNIELYRWVRAEAKSMSGLTLEGAEVQANNLDTEYSVSGDTNSQGLVYLKVLTDIISEEEPDFYGNYEFSASYSPVGETDTYTVDAFTQSLPNYPETEYVINIEMRFENLVIPDLVLSEANLRTNTTDISVGDPVTLLAEVYNAGETDAQGVTVNFYLIKEDETEVMIGSDTLELVPSMDVSTASVSWTAEMNNDELKQESMSIRVAVDPDVEPIDDGNTANNEATMTVSVKSLPKLDFASDIIIRYDGKEVSPDKNLTERDNIEITIHITNTGGTFLKNASVEVKAAGKNLTHNYTDVESGQVVNFTTQWLIKTRGTQTIHVWYNSSGEDPKFSEHISRSITIESLTFDYRDVVALKTDPGADKIVQGVLKRDDGKAIAQMNVTAYLLDEDQNVIEQGTSKTDDNGNFLIQIPEPDEGGKYSVSLQAEHPDSERVTTGAQVDVEGAAEEGIPLWMIIGIIGAIAAVSVGGIFVYMRYQPPGEWVECGNCGSTIPADSTECPECGVEFETDTVKCSECGQWIPSDADVCPNCGSEFIKTGKEVQDYGERMREQYEAYVDKQKEKAVTDLGEEFTEEEFMEWWQEQPSYITFDEWLEREEARRKEGGIECPECGALNSIDAAICQKCGSTLIHVEEEKEEEPQVIRKEEEEPEKPEMEELTEEQVEEKEEKPKKVVKKKVKKKPKKVVKKKVKKKPKKKDEEE